MAADAAVTRDETVFSAPGSGRDAAVAISGLTIGIPGPGGPTGVVDGVDFDIAPGEVLGLVGESGSGKSLTAQALMGLLPMAGAEMTGGQIMLAGEDVSTLSDAQWRRHRGRTAAMVFQDPLMSLNPVYTVGDQIAEVLIQHRGWTRGRAWQKAITLLAEVGLPEPETRVRAYPHQLSGGMRQRVMIAMALACEPALLIADEPTTALDVTIQAQILDLINRLRRDGDTAVLFISHDLAVIGEIADRVAVMYAGRIVEVAPTERFFQAPEHPYSVALISSAPDLDRPDRPLTAIPGTVPGPADMPPGCRLAPRCPFAQDTCSTRPDLREIAESHAVACHFAPMFGGLRHAG